MKKPILSYNSNERFLRCPCKKKSTLTFGNTFIRCNNGSCVEKFSYYNDKPLLISFKKCDTICNKNFYSLKKLNKSDLYVKRSFFPFKQKVKNFVCGDSVVSKNNCLKFIQTLKIGKNKKVNVLLIGSGSRGDSVEALFNSPVVNLHKIDIYSSDSVDIIADAHYLPFASGIFDGVWIQAVIEHLVDPNLAVKEIHRVMKPAGVIYAETPFMQQIHEGAYDFTRFTISGHRYLFKDFKQVAIGSIGSPGLASWWSIRYLFLGIFRNKFLSNIISLPFLVFFRFIDCFSDQRIRWDASFGVFFLGVKSKKSFSQSKIPSIYKGML
jgi:SAM-dependent methyltransferase